jgi:hypothetical protein
MKEIILPLDSEIIPEQLIGFDENDRFFCPEINFQNLENVLT